MSTPIENADNDNRSIPAQAKLLMLATEMRVPVESIFVFSQLIEEWAATNAAKLPDDLRAWVAQLIEVQVHIQASIEVLTGWHFKIRQTRDSPKYDELSPLESAPPETRLMVFEREVRSAAAEVRRSAILIRGWAQSRPEGELPTAFTDWMDRIITNEELLIAGLEAVLG